MKSAIPVIGIIALSCVPSFAQLLDERTTEGWKEGIDMISKESVFNAETETKVIKFFDNYKTKHFGLPAEWLSSMRGGEIPAEWRSARVLPGTVITDTQRMYLHAPPSDLLALLPTAPSNLKYYLAGSNLLAIDDNFRVVDSIHIPSIKFAEE